MSMKILVGLFFFCGSVIAQEAPGTCTLPSGEEGTCVPWTGCPPYQSHIDAGRDSPESTEFLRNRICRFDPPNVWLCCPGKVQLQQTIFKAPSRVTIPTESECGANPKREKNHPGAWPWLAVIIDIRETEGLLPVCAGALITRRHVLSAASCMSYGRENLIVRLGEYNIENDRAGEQPQEFRIILFNTDQYASYTHENDIVIFPLDRDVVFTRNIYPVCLPFPFVGKDLTGERMTVAGWGDVEYYRTPEYGDNRGPILPWSFRAGTGEYSVHSRVPLAADLVVANKSVCAASYEYFGIVVSDKHICAGERYVSTCWGDAGAPLNYYSQEKDKYYVTGLVSFGAKCGSEDIPDVYTRVTSYLTWITFSIKGTVI